MPQVKSDPTSVCRVPLFLSVLCDQGMIPEISHNPEAQYSVQLNQIHYCLSQKGNLEAIPMVFFKLAYDQLFRTHQNIPNGQHKLEDLTSKSAITCSVRSQPFYKTRLHQVVKFAYDKRALSQSKRGFHLFKQSEHCGKHPRSASPPS